MESGTQGRSVTVGTAGRAIQTDSQDMKIRDVMSKDVITALPGDSVFDAAQRMAEARVSCLVVVDGGRVLGILTERDVLKAVAGPQADFRRITVAQTMSSPVQSVTASLSVLAAGRIMQARQIRRLPVIEGKQLLGVVTQTDITRGLIMLTPLRSIGDVMTREVISIEVDASVAEAARVMASKRISCIVTTRQDGPAGILTEKDLIRRIVMVQKDPSQTRVSDVMSCPIITVSSSDSIMSAGRKMDAMHLHRLVVMDEGELCGIVTQTDIMRAIRTELGRVENERWGWMTELATQVQCTLGDLEKLQELLRKLNGTSGASRNSVDMEHIAAGSRGQPPGGTDAGK